MYVTHNRYKGTKVWAQNYLTTESNRLTSLLREDCRDEYETYFEIVQRYFNNGDMVFRLKIIENDTLNILEYWKNRKFTSYFNELKAKTTMMESMIRQGFDVSMSFEKDKNSEQYLRQILQNGHPLLVQYINDDLVYILEENNITSGDPLKDGKSPDQW